MLLDDRIFYECQSCKKVYEVRSLQDMNCPSCGSFRTMELARAKSAAPVQKV